MTRACTRGDGGHTDIRCSEGRQTGMREQGRAVNLDQRSQSLSFCYTSLDLNKIRNYYT